MNADDLTVARQPTLLVVVLSVTRVAVGILSGSVALLDVLGTHQVK